MADDSIDSKFDKIFQKADTPPPTATSEKPRRELTTKTRGSRNETISSVQTIHTGRPLGRPHGKRSDPAWKQFSLLLKRQTQRTAAAILRDRDEGLDLSGLVQSLLEDWVKKQKS
jgi:hypothetical protein